MTTSARIRKNISGLYSIFAREEDFTSHEEQRLSCEILVKLYVGQRQKGVFKHQKNKSVIQL